MIRLFAHHPTAGNLLMVLFLALGLFGLAEIRRESMPQMALSKAMVTVDYPGASALEVEEAICQPLEEALQVVAFLDEVTAEALEGRAKVTVEMVEGADYLAFYNDLDDEISAIDTLPTDAEDPILEALGKEEIVLSILVSGPEDVTQLKAYCEDLEDRLRRLPEVSLVEIFGFSDRQYRVELSAEALARYGLGASDVASSVAAQSIDLPAGTIETSETDFLLRFVERRRTPGEIEDIVVRASAGGAEIRLGELGRVVDVFENEFDEIDYEGRRGARIEVRKTRAEDSLRIADAVRLMIEEERQRLPENMSLALTGDASTNLRGQIDLVVSNGWQGMILVALSLWLFFNWRLAMWVVIGLPVSFLGASFFMPAVGMSVNILTLIGFLLALGLLMDDAIVIAENIASHMRRGTNAMEAAIAGVSEVKVGVFASFLTTACVLGPLTLIGGDIGQRLRVVPIILVLVLSVSLVEAFLILPGHLGHSMKAGEEQKNAFRAFVDRTMTHVRENWVGGAIDRLLERRYLFLGTVFAMLISCVGLLAGGRIPFQALPDVEGDVIVARVLLPQGTPLTRTRMVVADVLRGLNEMNAEWTRQQPDGKSLVLQSYVEYGTNKDAYESGAHVATVTVDLLTAEERNGRIDDYLLSWRESTGPVSDVLAVNFTTPAVGAAGQPIEIRLRGDDLDDLAQAATEVEDYLRPFSGVTSLLADLRPGKPEVRLSVLEGAAGLGLDANQIAQQVSASYRGRVADELQIGPETYEIDVRLAPSERDTLSDMRRMRVPLPGGGTAPLESVAKATLGMGWARIARIDGVRTVTVRGDVDPERGNTAATLAAFETDFLPKLLDEHPGVQVDLAGESAETAETQASMASYMVLGLFGVFLLLSFQFKSYLEPLIVMVAIPLSLIGVILGHFVMNFPFTLPSMLGFISLSGVVVNDSLLLVEFIKIERRAGMDPRAAAARASRARFRAVLLTSSTTIAGLLPLLAEGSLQAQILKGLVISVAFGLMASTLLVLLVIPCLYTVLDDLGWTRKIETERAHA